MTCCRPNTSRISLYRLTRLSSGFSRSKLVSPVIISMLLLGELRVLSNQLASSSIRCDLLITPLELYYACFYWELQSINVLALGEDSLCHAYACI